MSIETGSSRGTSIVDKTIEELIGDPRQVAADMEAFEKDTDSLWSQMDALRQKYPNRWIAFRDGQVLADAETLDTLLSEVDRLGIPRLRTIVERLDTTEQRLIL